MTDLAGNNIPGNWGTVDIGNTSNSTAEISDQILDGLRQSDLDALYADGRIPQSTHIDGNSPAWMQGAPGLSIGMKAAVWAVHGTTRLVPIYDSLAGQLTGNNVEIQIVGWGVIQVVTSNWGGAHNTSVTVQKGYMYDGDLRPNPDLSDTTDIIENAFTSPVLVE